MVEVMGKASLNRNEADYEGNISATMSPPIIEGDNMYIISAELRGNHYRIVSDYDPSHQTNNEARKRRFHRAGVLRGQAVAWRYSPARANYRRHCSKMKCSRLHAGVKSGSMGVTYILALRCDNEANSMKHLIIYEILSRRLNVAVGGNIKSLTHHQ